MLTGVEVVDGDRSCQFHFHVNLYYSNKRVTRSSALARAAAEAESMVVRYVVEYFSLLFV